MPEPAFRVILDTNTVLRGLASPASAATPVLRAGEDRLIIPLLSKPLLDEYRAVLSDGALRQRIPSLTAERVAVTLSRLRFVSDYVRTRHARFEYPRDPRDEKLIELAIELKATQIITGDDDLLFLPKRRSVSGRRYRQRLPRTEILTASAFLRRHHSP